MTLYVPEASLATMLEKILNQSLTLKLYSNNVIPSAADTTATYTEVSGGGYVSKTLTFANWVITPGGPAVALYNAFQDWFFTGATDAPGTIFGYFVIQTTGGLLLWAERFPAATIPFVSQNGSLIRIKPRFTERNQP